MIYIDIIGVTYLNKKPFSKVGSFYGPGIKRAGIVNNFPISNPLPPVVSLCCYIDEYASSLTIKGKLVNDEQWFIQGVDLNLVRCIRFIENNLDGKIF